MRFKNHRSNGKNPAVATLPMVQDDVVITLVSLYFPCFEKQLVHRQAPLGSTFHLAQEKKYIGLFQVQVQIFNLLSLMTVIYQ